MTPSLFARKSIGFQLGDALALCPAWPAPTVIISDGPYGVSGYEGDLHKAEGLANWYDPHVAAWSELSTPFTTLWFWNTELGWAEVHPVLKKYGWVYRSCNIWNKGIGHIAGNSNTKTLRRFPVVTEVCAHYVRHPKFVLGENHNVSAQDWLRAEWLRTGLPFYLANEACGVKNAATRKYLTSDYMWYFPPPEIFSRMAKYANEKGEPTGKPYFSMDGTTIITKSQWEQLRGKFYCGHGVTNVWDVPAVRGTERIKVRGKSLHPNQKPLELMELLVKSSSDPGDVVWEPFGGLCTGSIAAVRLGRKAFASEINHQMYKCAKSRLNRMGIGIEANS